MSNGNLRQAVPFFWVRDIERTVRFYADGLGFVVTKEWRDDGRLRWCWLERDGVAVMLQEFWTDGPDRNLPEGQVGAGAAVYFVCDDAVALWRGFVARGLPAKRPFVGNGMWVTEVPDPDGYVLFFESPADAPEESVLPPEHG
jgi:catechol 2,3-dioxygenase-like lactoylglutathione lyase family enzyme